MIQRLLRSIGSAGGRRGIGLLLVLVVAVLAVAGAAHASPSGDGVCADHDATCAVCDAVLAAGGAALPAPTIAVTRAVECHEPLLPAVVSVPLVSEPGRIAAPRGPPARS